MQNIALAALSNTLRGLRDEITVAKLTKRTRQCTIATVATAVAIYVSHWLRLEQIWWPAICAFSLTGLEVKASLRQGTQQIAGTLCGTTLGWLLSQYVAGGIGPFVLCVIGLSSGGLYLATSRAASYMWILSTVLAIFMIASVRAHPATNPADLVVALSVGALTGTIAYWLVCLAADMLVRIFGGKTRAGDAAASAPSASTQATLGRLRHTVAGAVTLSVLAYLAFRYPLEGFAQAMTTALVTLLVPLDASGAWSPYAVALRMCHRLLGCLIGSVFVIALVPLTAGNMHLCVVALCVLVWLSCHFRFGDLNVSYAGTQFGAVVILAFVHDQAWLSDDVHAAYGRLLGVTAGIVVLTVVLAVVGRTFRGWPLSRSERGFGTRGE
ncbi:FUSC family protein [Caballeronia sp. INDeC2]|uniref:FUSC family protein n=1 Tax=Caballeronia sp. INDeC2 TaxID=2921747 RepID=UPI00202797DD|nr:FUSC family protein [Caballeronia sp. INDeC2]